MTLKRRLHLNGWAIGLVVLLVECGLGLAPAVGQNPRGKAPAPEPANKEVQIFPLKYARAEEMANLLNTILIGASGGSASSFMADARSNAVVVAGPKAEIDKVQALIAQLDTERVDGGPPPVRLKVYALGSVEPNKVLLEAFQMLLAPRGGHAAVDEQRRVAIVSADEVGMKGVEELLRNLQGGTPRAPIVDVKVRVLWLVSGLKGEDAAPVPDDLKEVVAGLAKLGIDRPRLAAQTLVNGTVGSQFQAQGVAKLEAVPCRFTVSGRLSVKGETPALEITLQAAQSAGRGPGEVPLCDLRTEITAPVGHFVVLGMTPTEARTSVFVVQVLQPEVRAPGPPK